MNDIKLKLNLNLKKKGDDLKKNYEKLIEISEKIYELLPMIHNSYGPLQIIDSQYLNNNIPKVKQYLTYHFLE